MINFSDKIYCIALLPKKLRKNLEIILATRYWEKDVESGLADPPKAWDCLTSEDGFSDAELKGVNTTKQYNIPVSNSYDFS